MKVKENSDIEIRLAKRKDIRLLAELMHEEHEDPIDFVKSRATFYIGAGGFILLALDKKNNAIAGRIFFRAIENPKLGVGEIEGVEVSRAYRGRGIGNLLLERTIIEARNYFKGYGIKIRWLELKTRSNNKAAIALYKKHGFKDVALLGKVFTDNEPSELYMARFNF